jgi:hypothetical protein
MASRRWEATETNEALVLLQRVGADKGKAPAPLRAQAERLLRDRPMEARAVTALGALADQQADQRAESLMRAAVRLNRRERAAGAWLVGHELQRRDYRAAFTHANALLRMRSGLASTLHPALLGSLRDPAALQPLAQILATNPPWRRSFMEMVIRGQVPPQVGQAIMSEMVSAGGKVDQVELSWLLERLVNEGQYEQAYLNWLLFIPVNDLSKLRTVYDGDFDGWPEVYPFTWSLGSGVRGVVAEPVRYGRPEPALLVEYDGVSDVRFPRQMLMLTPGSYQLRGEYLTPSEESAGRVKLEVSCQPSGDSIGAFLVQDTKARWVKFASDFTVPNGCVAQWLSVMPEPGQRRSRVEVWFDAIEVDASGPPS